MRVHLHPQRRTVEVAGRRSVGRLLTELGVLPNTAMVIRRDELLTDGEMVEDTDEIEIRAVISGGVDDPTQPDDGGARMEAPPGGADAHRSTAPPARSARGREAGSLREPAFA
jgi:sulfur carrier protein ThiS